MHRFGGGLSAVQDPFQARNDGDRQWRMRNTTIRISIVVVVAFLISLIVWQQPFGATCRNGPGFHPLNNSQQRCDVAAAMGFLAVVVVVVNVNVALVVVLVIVVIVVFYSTSIVFVAAGVSGRGGGGEG